MTARIALLAGLLVMMSTTAEAHKVRPGQPRPGPNNRPKPTKPLPKPKPAPKPKPNPKPEPVVEAVTTETTLHAAIAPNGDEVRLVTQLNGKSTATLQTGNGAATKLFTGDSVGAIEVAHGKVVVALAVTDETEPFRIHVGGKESKLKRPGKRYDLPFAMAMASTPTGFTVFFQEIEAQNVNEAHTYMVKLDKDGVPDGNVAEVQVPWWIGDAAWNGKGYHVALYYAGEMQGARLSMVSLTEAGAPEQHPDWASNPGALSDMNLVASGGKVHAYYRGGAGDKMYVTDVTKIGQWGGNPQSAKDLGALPASSAIAINAKGQPVRVKGAGK